MRTRSRDTEPDDNKIKCGTVERKQKRGGQVYDSITIDLVCRCVSLSFYCFWLTHT